MAQHSMFTLLMIILTASAGVHDCASLLTTIARETSRLEAETERLAANGTPSAAVPGLIRRASTARGCLGLALKTAMGGSLNATEFFDVARCGGIQRTLEEFQPYAWAAELDGETAAEFRIFPAKYTRMRQRRQGVPNEAMVFAMFAKAEGVRAASARSTHAHVADAFAHLRFYRRDDTFYVTEIQSDVYRDLDAEVKPRWKNWSRQLMFAFEAFVRDLAPRGRVRVVTEEFLRRKWTEVETPPTALWNLLYAQLPKRIGYVRVTIPEVRLEWEENKRRQMLGISEVWERELATTRALNLKVRRENVFASALTAVENLKVAPLPSNESDPLGPLHGLISVASERVPYSQIPGVDVSHLKTLSQLLPSSIGALATDLFSASATYLSLGILDDTVRGFEDRADEIAVHHLSGMDRHPRVTLLGDDGRRASLGLKGGGSLAWDQSPDGYGVVGGPEPSRPFAWRFDEKSRRRSSVRTYSHQIWGGMRLDEADAEFANSLAIHHLVRRLGLLERAAAPIPIQISRLKEAYAADADGSLRRMSMTQYKRRFLRPSPEPLVVYQSFTNSRLRVGHIWASMQNQMSRNDARVALDTLLVDAYAAWGERPRLPNPELLAGAGEADVASRAQYLAQTYTLNRDVADRIWNEVRTRSIRTLAAVHAHDGHLGGHTEFIFEKDGQIHVLEKALGAPTGGAAESRNVTLAGEFCDLDDHVFLPWLDRPGLQSSRRTVEKYLRTEFRVADWKYWDSTMYWLERLLIGRDVPAKFDARRHMYGDPEERLLVIFRDEFDPQVEWAWRRLKMIDAEGLVTFTHAEDQAAYDQAMSTK